MATERPPPIKPARIKTIKNTLTWHAPRPGDQPRRVRPPSPSGGRIPRPSEVLGASARPPKPAQHAPVQPSGNRDEQPTILIIGSGDPVEEAVRAALIARGAFVESFGRAFVCSALIASAPDIVLLLGDAAADAGASVLKQLQDAGLSDIAPIALLASDPGLEARIGALRNGVHAVVPRTASVEEIATRVEQALRETASTTESKVRAPTEATFEELLGILKRELKSGVLSAHGIKEGEGAPVRLTLRSGQALTEAMDAFVDRLRRVVARAEPVSWELGANDAEAPRAPTLVGMRLAIVAESASSADALAQHLRALGVEVIVVDADGAGLERARQLDPHVLLLDERAVRHGPHLQVFEHARSDVRLRWAPIMLAPSGAGDDLATLVATLAAILDAERAIERKLSGRRRIDVRLDAIGPARLLRMLAATPGTKRLVVRGRRAHVQVDVSDGLIAGATMRVGDQVVEGVQALTTLLGMTTGWTEIARAELPGAANIMAPVDVAIGMAVTEPGPITPSMLPPRGDAAVVTALASRASRTRERERADASASYVVPVETAQTWIGSITSEPELDEADTTTFRVGDGNERADQTEETAAPTMVAERARGGRAGTAFAIALASCALVASVVGLRPGPDFSRSASPVASRPEMVRLAVPQSQARTERAMAANAATAGAALPAAAERRSSEPAPVIAVEPAAPATTPGEMQQPAAEPAAETAEAENDAEPAEAQASASGPPVCGPQRTATRVSEGAKSRSRAHVRSAERLMEEGDHRAARADLCAALRLNPRNNDAMVDLAKSLLATEEAAGAVEWADLAVAQNPRRVGYRLLLATAHERSGNVASARAVRRIADSIVERRDRNRSRRGSSEHRTVLVRDPGLGG